MPGGRLTTASGIDQLWGLTPSRRSATRSGPSAVGQRNNLGGASAK